MSGQPTRNPTDASKFRQQYLANLNLQASIDDMNLKANQIFNKTGSTPSQPTDTRTTAEKLADVERLKIEVRGELSKIADGTQAQAIVEGLNETELLFVSQHIDEIVTILKPKYKLGVLSTIFIPFLQTYMNNANQTNEVNFGLQQSSGSNLILGVKQMGEVINDVTIQQIEDSLSKSNGIMSVVLLSQIGRELQSLESLLPSRAFLQALNNVPDANVKATLQQGLADALEVLPTKSQVITLLRDLETALSRRDKPATDNIGVQILQLITLDPATRQMLQSVIRDTSQGVLTSFKPKPPTNQYGFTQAEIDEIRNYMKDISGITPTAVAYKAYIKELRDLVKTNRAITSKEIGYKQNATLPELADVIGRLNNAVVPLISVSQRTSQVQIKKSPTSTPQKQGGTQSPTTPSGVAGLKLSAPPTTPKGKGIMGMGLATPKHYKTKPIPIDYTAGVITKNKYAPFGRYFIDSNRIKENIIAVKRANGVNISDLPIRLVSKNLGEVVRTILGGGLPQYHQINELEDSEKQYLHKIAKKTQLLDRISIPTPNRNEDEKDINQFEIYKGEILNGNDSVDLVKKFKLLIVKLVSRDLLPKGQAKEILMELATLGY